MTPYRYSFFLLLLVFVLSPQAGCKKSGDTKTDKAQEVALNISVAEAIREDVERSVDITGTLAAWEEATISIEVDGRLIEATVDLGDRVKKGDVLARIMPVEYEWKRTQAEADLLTAEADSKRMEQLQQNSVASKQQADEAHRKLEVARAAADLARKKLADTVLRAPFDGAVGSRLVNQGEYVRSGSAAFFLVRLNPLKFKGDVPERYAADVHAGDHVSIHTASAGSTTTEGTIVRVGPSVASDSRSFPVEAEVDNSQGSIKPGSFARASILTHKMQNVLTIPETAVYSFAGTPRVYVVQDNAARERIVETAGKVRDRVVIANGLTAGEKVAITGVELLVDGQKVAIR